MPAMGKLGKTTAGLEGGTAIGKEVGVSKSGWKSENTPICVDYVYEAGITTREMTFCALEDVQWKSWVQAWRK